MADPRAQDRGQAQPSHNLLKGLGAAAMTLGGWAVYHKVSVAALSKGSERALQFFASLRNAPITKGIRNVLSQDRANELSTAAKEAMRYRTSGHGSITREMSQMGHFLEQAAPKLMKPVQALDRKAQDWYAFQKKVKSSVGSAEQAVERLKRLKEMSSPARRRLLTSGVAAYAKEASVEAPVFYLGERALGMFGESDESRMSPRPAWYNLPGQAADAAKWAAWYAPLDLAGRVVLGGVAPAGLQAIKRFSPNLKAISHEVQTGTELIESTLRRGATHLKAFDETAANVYQARERMLFRDKTTFSRYHRNRKGIRKPIKENLKVFRDMYRENLRKIHSKERPVTEDFGHALRWHYNPRSSEHDEVASVFGHIVGSLDKDLTKLLDRNTFGKWNAKTKSYDDPALSFMAKAFGLRRARLRDFPLKVQGKVKARLTSAYHTASESYHAANVKQEKQLKRLFYGHGGNMEDMLADPHIYFNEQTNQLWNTQHWSMKRVLASSLEFARKKINLGRRFAPLDMFQVHAVTSQTPDVHVVRGQHAIHMSQYTRPEYYPGEAIRKFGTSDKDLPALAIKNPDRGSYDLFEIKSSAGGNRTFIKTASELNLVAGASHGKLKKIVERWSREDIGTKAAASDPVWNTKAKENPESKYWRARKWLYEKLQLGGGVGDDMSVFQRAIQYVHPLRPHNLLNFKDGFFSRGWDYTDYVKTSTEFWKRMSVMDATMAQVRKQGATTIAKTPELMRSLFSTHMDDSIFGAMDTTDILYNDESVIRKVEQVLSQVHHRRTGIDPKAFTKRVQGWNQVEDLVNLYRKSPDGMAALENPVGERNIDRMRRFLVETRMAELEQGNLLDDVAGGMLSQAKSLRGTYLTERDTTMVEGMFTAHKWSYAKPSPAPITTLSQLDTKEQTADDLLGVLRDMEDRGTAGRLQRAYGKFGRGPQVARASDQSNTLSSASGMDPYMLISHKKGDIAKLTGSYIYDSFGQVMDWMGLGWDRGQTYGAGAQLALWGKRAAFAGAVYKAYDAVNTMVDVNPMFSGTVLDDGITTGAADVSVASRMLASKIYDIAGVTDFSRYMEGLMPGSSQTLPGAAMGFMAGGIPGAIAGGILNKWVGSYLAESPLSGLALLPPLAPFVADLTKSHEELQKMYSGEDWVPIRSGRWWSIGSTTPFSGGRVKQYAPNWYARTKSNWKSSDAMYGSEISRFFYEDIPVLDFAIGDLWKPDFLESKHMTDRPYPSPDIPFSEVPIVGPALGYTVGRAYRWMQDTFNPLENGMLEEWRAMQNLSAGYSDGSGDAAIVSQATGPWTAPDGLQVSNQGNLRTMLSEQVYRGFIEPVGLIGFSTSAALWNGREPYSGEPVLANAGRMDSFTREYWDQNTGGMLLLNEGFRRLFPRQRTNVDRINPYQNEMPDWMPEDFQSGDPYCLARDTLVETIHGLRRADEIRVGELIRTAKGRWYPIRDIYPRPVDEELYEIQLAGIGRVTRVTSEHPFYVDHEWTEARHLEPGDFVLYPMLREKARPEITLSGTSYPLNGEMTRLMALLLQGSKPLQETNTWQGPHREEIASLIHRSLQIPIDEQPTHPFLQELVTMLHTEGLPSEIYHADVPALSALMKPYAEYDRRENIMTVRMPTQSVAYQLWSSFLQHGLVGEWHGQVLVFRGSMARSLAEICGWDPAAVYSGDSDWYQIETRVVDDHLTEVTWVAFRIESIHLVHYTDDVYGFEVDTDDSFCVPAALTHNTKVPHGEVVLPGSGYESIQNVNYTFPTSTEVAGLTQYGMALEMIGLGDTDLDATRRVENNSTIKEMIGRQMTQQNQRVRADALVVDPYAKISGHVDFLLKQGYADVPVEVKAVTGEFLKGEHGPKRRHVIEVNALAQMLGSPKGEIIYVDQDNPANFQVETVHSDPRMYEETVRNVDAARNLARHYVSQGFGNEYAGYDYLDRLKILTASAPFSQEYKDTAEIVAAEVNSGAASTVDEERFSKYQQMHKHMLRKYDMYAYRFASAWKPSTWSNLTSPDIEYHNYSMNEYIKAAAEYSPAERVAGSIWESFTHLRTPLHTKLFGMYTPLEQYERYAKMGPQFKSWGHPLDDWVKPAVDSALSVTNPVQGGLSFGLGGFLVGGGVGAMVAAPIGMMYGAVHGAYRTVTNSSYTPDRFQGMQNMQQYFDRVEYYRAQHLYQATRDPQYRDQMARTAVGWSLQGMEATGNKHIARQGHSAENQGVGNDRGFGSPWNGISFDPETYAASDGSASVRHLTERAAIQSGTAGTPAPVLSSSPDMAAAVTFKPGIMSTASRHTHNPAAQGIGADKGFGSPWQGMEEPLLSNYQFSQAFDAMPYWDKPFFNAFLETKDKDRQDEILRTVDSDLAGMLETAWGRGQGITYDPDAYFRDHYRPSMQHPMMHPDAHLEDYELKTVEAAGFRGHDFGLGWKDQLDRMQRTHANVEPIDINTANPATEETPSNMDPGTLQETVEQVLASFGIEQSRVDTMQNLGGGTRLSMTVNINRDRTDEIQSARQRRRGILVG